MNQIERIMKMETDFDETSAAVEKLQDALQSYEKVTDKIMGLEEYYASGQWLSDFEDDEEGKLPKDLKRRVLSEDGLFDFLNEVGEAERVMKSLSADDKNIYPSEYIYEIGYINGLLDMAGRFSDRISYSYVQAYGLRSGNLAESIEKLSEISFDKNWLTKSNSSLEEKLGNWYGIDELGIRIEKEVNDAPVIYDINEKFFDLSDSPDSSWTMFYTVEDGFVAEFKHFAVLFLLGNNE